MDLIEGNQARKWKRSYERFFFLSSILLFRRGTHFRAGHERPFIEVRLLRDQYLLNHPEFFLPFLLAPQFHEYLASNKMNVLIARQKPFGNVEFRQRLRILLLML